MSMNKTSVIMEKKCWLTCFYFYACNHPVLKKTGTGDGGAILFNMKDFAVFV